jgi:CheY-like chemotaxis protein
MSARILIIEDDTLSLTLAQYLLDAAGHRTLAVREGSTGIRAALAESWDLILCDLQMPQMNGYQVLADLKSDPNWKPVPLLAMTASSMPEDRRTALGAGFDGFLEKPIEPQHFVAQIEAYLHPLPVRARA